MQNVDVIVQRVLDLRKEKRLEDAEVILRKEIQEDETAWQLWNQLGHVLVANDNFSEAATAFENATRLNPNGFWLWLPKAS